MTNIKKFITAGLFLLASTSVLAEVGNDASKVQEDMSQFYAKISAMKLSNSTPEITITSENKGTKFSPTGKSMAFGSGNDCKVALDIKDIQLQGNKVKNFTENVNLINDTALKNETQKKMVGEFIAAHEHTHCDFPKNAIKVPNLNAEDNNFLNSIYNPINEYGQHDTHINYRTLVNENFADAGAMIIMLKHYGSDNKDLQYVLSVIEAHRADNAVNGFYAETIEEHFSYSVFSEINKNLEKVDKIKNSEEFTSYLLEVANKGALQAVVDKKGVGVEIAFSQTDRFIDNYIRGYVVNSMVGGVDLEKDSGILGQLAKKVNDKIDKSELEPLLKKYKAGTINNTEGAKLRVALLKSVNEVQNKDPEISKEYQNIVSKISAINVKMQNYSSSLTQYQIPTTNSILSKIRKSHEEFENGSVNKTVRKIS